MENSLYRELAHSKKLNELKDPRHYQRFGDVASSRIRHIIANHIGNPST